MKPAQTVGIQFEHRAREEGWPRPHKITLDTTPLTDRRPQRQHRLKKIPFAADGEAAILCRHFAYNMSPLARDGMKNSEAILPTGPAQL